MRFIKFVQDKSQQTDRKKKTDRHTERKKEKTDNLRFIKFVQAAGVDRGHIGD